MTDRTGPNLLHLVIVLAFLFMAGLMTFCFLYGLYAIGAWLANLTWI